MGGRRSSLPPTLIKIKSIGGRGGGWVGRGQLALIIVYPNLNTKPVGVEGGGAEEAIHPNLKLTLNLFGDEGGGGGCSLD